MGYRRCVCRQLQQQQEDAAGGPVLMRNTYDSLQGERGHVHSESHCSVADCVCIQLQQQWQLQDGDDAAGVDQ